MALNPKQQRFVEEYLIDLNATQAAIRAGYSAKTANRIGTENLSKLVIQAEIAERQAERAIRVKITADMVLQELGRIAFTDRRKIFSWGPDGVKFVPSESLDEATAALVEKASQTVTEGGGTIRVKTSSKIEALKLIGQHLGAHVERMEHSGPGGKPIAIADSQRTARIVELIELARARGVAFPSGSGNGKPADLASPARPADDGARKPG